MSRQLVRSARETIRREYGDVVAAIDAAADAAALSRTGVDPASADSTAGRLLAARLEAELASRGVLAALPSLLADAVAAADRDLSAEPVAAPPYVAVTSRGPIARATIEPGRLVIRFDAFEVDSDRAPPYRRLDGVSVVVSLADRRETGT